MAKISKHIEIVTSINPSLSSMSARSREAIQATLSQYYTRVGITTVDTISDLEDLVAAKPDLVFLGMKFIPSNPTLKLEDPHKIWISDYLDEFDIPYTGSSQQAHELELNKHLAKQRAIDVNLRTSPFYVALQNQLYPRHEMLLTFPLFIKPTNRGGGLGVDDLSVAHNFDDLESKVASITLDHESDSLVEEYLPGREFSVAILRNERSAGYAVMPIELVAEENEHGMRLLGGDTKSSNTEGVLPVTDIEIRIKINKLALSIFKALGARDYGRIDIRLDANGHPHFLEANLLPSLITGYGSFPKACVINQQLDYEPMILQIVRLALNRNASVTPGFSSPTPVLI